MQATTNQTKSAPRNLEPKGVPVDPVEIKPAPVPAASAPVPAPITPGFERAADLEAGVDISIGHHHFNLPPGPLPSLIPSSAAILERLEVLDKERNLLRRLLKIAEAQEGAGE